MSQANTKNHNQNSEDRSANDSLEFAILSLNPAEVRRWLDEGADPNRISDSLSSPLEMALLIGNQEIVSILIEAGAEIGLREAVLLGDIPRTSAFLEEGADVNDADRSGSKLLHLAAGHGKTEVAKELLRRGAYVDPLTSNGHTPLMTAAFKNDFRTVEALRLAGAKIGLFEAAVLGDLELTRKFTERGAEIDSRNDANMTALMGASKCGRKECVGHLLEMGADIQAQSSLNLAAIHFAVVNNRLEIIQLLLDSGVNISERVLSPDQHNHQNSILHYAAGKGV